MRFLLIQPPNNFLEQAYGVKSKLRFGYAPPLGIGYIAATLESGGHQVRLLDALAMELTLPEISAEIRSFAPDVVGLSVLTNYSGQASELADHVKHQFPHIVVLLGGPHATYFFPEILNEMKSVDHVLYGEVDAVILEYAKHLQTRSPELFTVRGLVYRDSAGRPQVNPPPEPVKDLDTLPMPAWHLYDMALYRPLPFQYRQTPFFTMITSRGCAWGKCTFCFQAGSYRPPYRRHSPGRVLEEMEVLSRKYGIREVAFWDDSFIMTSSWMREFSEGARKRALPITWVASGRANVITEELVQLAAKAGCWSIFVGVESGNQGLLDNIEKGITLNQVRRAFAAIRAAGLESRGAFMLGLPGETPEMGQNTIDFARELNPTYAIFYATHPRKGTRLYDEALLSGMFLSQSFRGMTKVTYVPEGYKSARQLASLMRRAYRLFYLRPRVILNFLRKVRSPGTLFEGIKAFSLFLGLSNAQ